MKLLDGVFYTGVILFIVGSSVAYLEFAPVNLLQCDAWAVSRGLLGATVALTGWLIVRTAINRASDQHKHEGTTEMRKR